MVGPYISKKEINFRVSVSATNRPAVTLFPRKWRLVYKPDVYVQNLKTDNIRVFPKVCTAITIALKTYMELFFFLYGVGTLFIYCSIFNKKENAFFS